MTKSLFDSYSLVKKRSYDKAKSFPLIFQKQNARLTQNDATFLSLQGSSTFRKLLGSHKSDPKSKLMPMPLRGFSFLICRSGSDLLFSQTKIFKFYKQIVLSMLMFFTLSWVYFTKVDKG